MRLEIRDKRLETGTPRSRPLAPPLRLFSDLLSLISYLACLDLPVAAFGRAGEVSKRQVAK